MEDENAPGEVAPPTEAAVEAPPAEAPPATEGEAPPAADAPPSEYDLLGDDAPQWLASLDRISEIENRSSFKVSREAIDALPIEAQQVIHNLRNLALKDRQSTVEAKREIETARAEIAREREALRKEIREERARTLALFQGDEMKKLLEKQDLSGVDPYSREGIQKLAQAAAGERLAAFQKALEEQAARQDQEMAAQQAEAAKEARKVEVRRFIEATPDFNDYRAQIIELRKRVDYRLTAEEAYEMLKAQKIAAEQAELASARSDARSRTARPTGQQHRAPEIPANLRTTREIAAWLQANPDAQEHYLRQFQRKGVSHG